MPNKRFFISIYEEPHPYRWGILQFKLRLTRVLPPLIPHIPADGRFVNAHRWHEKSSCPDSFAIPVYLLQEVREFFPQSPAGKTFHRFNHFRYRILRRDHHAQVDVIGFDANLFHVPIRIKFPHFPDRLFEVLRDAMHEDFSSVSRNPHDMVLRLVYNVCLPMEFHATIIPRAARRGTLLSSPPLQVGNSRGD